MPWFKRGVWIATTVMFTMSAAYLLVNRSASAIINALFWGMCAVVVLCDLRDDNRMARQIRWLRSGCCVFCGYDLRGSMARCPECGKDLTELDAGYPD